MSDDAAARKRESNRRWQKANRDHINAARREKRRADPEKVKAEKAAYYNDPVKGPERREKRRVANRDYMRRRAAAAKIEAETATVAVDPKRAAVERAKAWAAANPERRREISDRWTANNPEKARESSRSYYHRNKDAIKERRLLREAADPEKAREKRRQYNAAARAARREPYTRTPEQRERHNAAERESRRIKRLLEKSGLPPKQLHRVTLAERTANQHDADAFYSRKWGPADVARITQADQTTPSELLQEWAQSSALFRRRLTALDKLGAYLAKHGNRLREDIAMDSRAREQRGLPPLHMEIELRSRALAALDPPNSRTQAPEVSPSPRNVGSRSAWRRHEQRSHGPSDLSSQPGPAR